MNKKITWGVIVCAVFIFGFTISHAFAEDGDKSEDTTIKDKVQMEVKPNSTSLEEEKDKSPEVKKDDNVKENGEDSEGNDNNEATAESHRSEVSNFVQKILKVADKDKGVSEDIRIIAKDQSETLDKVATSVETIEKRSKWKTFFIGTDYKNVGAIRSEIAKTNNQIEQLNRLVDKTTNEADKAELKTQIESLIKTQEKLENFVKTNESKFSLFGWFTKLITKN